MELNDYFHPYYVMNFLLIFAYPILRIIIFQTNPKLEIRDELGYQREFQVLGTLLMIVLVKFLRKATNEQFLSDILMFCKLSAITLYFFINPNVAFWYIVGTSIIWLLTSPPRFSGPSKFIRIQSEEEFKEILNCKGTSKGKDNPYSKQEMIFVEFYANFADNCRTMKSMWADFSVRYSTEKFRFFEGLKNNYSVNVENFPDIALNNKINISAFSKQLPTLILFENGVEALRFPPTNEEGKTAKVLKYDRKELARYFDLERRYLATRSL